MVSRSCVYLIYTFLAVMADPSCNANYGGETVSLDSTVMLQNRALVTVATIAADDSDAKSGAQSLDQIFHPPWFDGQNSPSTEVEAPVPVAEVDFSIDSPFNTPYSLKDGAQILTGPDGYKALRIDKDGPYALIPGVNIGPSAMPACTLMIGLYVESFPKKRGWVFGHEDYGYDRTILVHDDRFGGGLASAVGKTWNPWTDGSKGKVPTKQWVHLTAVFRQNGDSYVYLNGIRSDNKVTAKNNEGRNDLYVGRPEWKGHWVDSWIKEVRVFDEALTDASVVDYTEKFLSQFPTTTTTTAVQAPVAEIDFSADSQSNTPYVLKDGAQILTAPGGFRALRIDKDGPYALIPGVNINPSAMPACTLMIGLYVESLANNRGWVFGHEESGYDRTIIVHDDRYGGGVASAVGKTWTPWTDASKGKVPIKQWVHLTAVFRQNGDSYVYLNGIRSDNKVIATNNEGRNDLYVGRPKGWSNHWVDSWIKEVKVFDQALTDGSIADYAKIFLSEASGVSGDTQGLASRSATDIWYSGCQQVDDLNQVLANVDGQMYGMTIGACFAKCKKKRGMKYFALTNGDQCLCSVTPPGQDIDEGSCNKKCSGKSNEICGGDSINIASVYTMVNCAPLPSSELDAEYKDALADLYEVWEGESCGKSDDNLCEIKGSAKMAADLKECKLACWEEQGSDKCNGFTYDKATSECTFYQDVLDGTVTKGPQLACFFKKLGYPLNLRE